MQLVAPDVDRVEAPRPAREQDLAEAAGRGADIDPDAARRIEAVMIERRRKLDAAARDVGMRRCGAQHRIDRYLIGGLCNRSVVGRHQPGGDGGLRFGAALEQPAFDQQPVGPHAPCHGAEIAARPSLREGMWAARRGRDRSHPRGRGR